MEEDSQLNHSSPFKELNCRKRQFWIQLWRYLKEAWTGVISGTGITIEFEDTQVVFSYFGIWFFGVFFYGFANSADV